MMEVIKYSEKKAQSQLNEMKLDWVVKNKGIEKSFEHSSFVEAFSFMTKVAILAEKKNHHPEWSNVHGKVDIRFTTHDHDGITNLDLEMVELIEKNI